MINENQPQITLWDENAEIKIYKIGLFKPISKHLTLIDFK